MWIEARWAVRFGTGRPSLARRKVVLGRPSMGFRLVSRRHIALERNRVGANGGRQFRSNSCRRLPAKGPRLQISRALEDGRRRCHLHRNSSDHHRQPRISGCSASFRHQRATGCPPRQPLARGLAGVLNAAAGAISFAFTPPINHAIAKTEAGSHISAETRSNSLRRGEGSRSNCRVCGRNMEL
jgi:hypothetical protein